MQSTTGQQINGEGQQEGCERFYWGDRKETLGTIRLTPGWGAELGGQQRDGPAVPGGSGSRFGVFPLDAVAVELENGVGCTLGSHEAALHLQRGGEEGGAQSGEGANEPFCPKFTPKSCCLPPYKLTSSAEQLPRVAVASTFRWALSMAKVRTAWASWGGAVGLGGSERFVGGHQGVLGDLRGVKER